jgi:lipoate-protein ligase A
MLDWNIYLTPNLSANENMALDEYFLRQLEEGKSGPVFRLYSWKPYCLSLGNSQNPKSEINELKLKQDQIDIVKRFTGGRAVLHQNEITYSVIGLNSFIWASSLKTTYEKISEILLDGLQTLGFKGTLERGDISEKTLRGQVAKPCFASTSRSELVFDTKKLVGSAQRRTRKAFLQHGSILLGEGHERLPNYLNLTLAEKNKFSKSLSENAITLKDALGYEPSWDTVANAIVKAWSEFTGAQASPLKIKYKSEFERLLEKYRWE